jgi:hypothetical protein
MSQAKSANAAMGAETTKDKAMTHGHKFRISTIASIYAARIAGNMIGDLVRKVEANPQDHDLDPFRGLAMETMHDVRLPQNTTRTYLLDESGNLIFSYDYVFGSLSGEYDVGDSLIQVFTVDGDPKELILSLRHD